MAVSTTSTVPGPPLPRGDAAANDWLRPYLRWSLIPSWILSGLIHAGVILTWISLSQSDGCRPDAGVGEGEGFREVGLVERPSEAEGDGAGEPGPEGPREASRTNSESTTADELVAESLSTPPAMMAAAPSAALPILGAGPPELSSGTGNTLLQPSGTGTAGIGGGPPAGGGVGGGGSTSLFGVNDAGRRFVYVIDNSGSMETHDALQSAKNELLRSVEALDEDQRFLVVFYNVQLTVLAPGSAPQQMFHGTDAHRLDLSRQIAPIEGDGGTDHVLALREALRYHADVIFFLTDAGRPGLTTSEIEDITSRNGGASRIHCIEFGDNPNFARDDPSSSFRRLADMNHGSYIYKDVRSFAP